MKSDAPSARTPSWTALVAVCKDCQKRGSGPRRLKAKEAIHEIRVAMKAERPRPRVVATGCLGLCPKRAIAIARVGSGGARIDTAEKAGEVAATMARLSAGPVGA